MKKILITVGMVIVSLGIVAGILITVAKREKAPEMETYAYDRLTMAKQESGNGQSQTALRIGKHSGFCRRSLGRGC